MRDLKEEFDRRGITVVVVSFAPPSRLADYREQQQWPFRLLSDPGRDAYRAFGLKRFSWFRLLAPATLGFYWRRWREAELPRFERSEDVFQGGGDFLLDRAGNVLFAHRSREPADRPPARRILEAFDQVASRFERGGSL